MLREVPVLRRMRFTGIVRLVDPRLRGVTLKIGGVEEVHRNSRCETQQDQMASYSFNDNMSNGQICLLVYLENRGRKVW